MRALPARRSMAIIAAAGTAAIIVGITGVAGGARPVASHRSGPVTFADASTTPASLDYECRFPAGTYLVRARVTGSYPAKAVPGRAVRPAALTLTVTVPAAALATIGPPRGGAITVSARLATSAANTAGTTPAAVWASLAAPSAPLPAAGQDLVSGPLRPAAPLPALTAPRSGPMTVTAGSLALRFTSAAKSPASLPSAVAATCAVNPGQDVKLATIAVASATASPAAAGPCPALPKHGLKLNPKFPLPKPPHGAIIFHSPSPDPGCAYIAGFNDVRKEYGAALLGPGLVNLDIGLRVVHTSNYFEEDAAGQLDYRACRTCKVVHGLPPARATFLEFGFVPVSATLHLTEVGTFNLIGVGTSFTLTSNTAWSLLELSVSDVTVNGQKLDVGGHCRTVKPLLVKLTGIGSGAHAYSLQQGGRLSGKVTVPPFTGCGVSENLDPLLTGTVSGPGNFALFTQGVLCTTLDGQGCPPRKPRPLR